MLAQWHLPFPQRSHHCSHMHIPARSPWLPGYIDVAQTVLIILTVAGLFPDIRYIRKEKLLLLLHFYWYISNHPKFNGLKKQQFFYFANKSSIWAGLSGKTRGISLTKTWSIHFQTCWILTGGSVGAESRFISIWDSPFGLGFLMARWRLARMSNPRTSHNETILFFKTWACN